MVHLTSDRLADAALEESDLLNSDEGAHLDECATARPSWRDCSGRPTCCATPTRSPSSGPVSTSGRESRPISPPITRTWYPTPCEPDAPHLVAPRPRRVPSRAGPAGRRRRAGRRHRRHDRGRPDRRDPRRGLVDRTRRPSRAQRNRNGGAAPDRTACRAARAGRHRDRAGPGLSRAVADQHRWQADVLDRCAAAVGPGNYPIPPQLGDDLAGFTIVDVSIEPYDGDARHSRRQRGPWHPAGMTGQDTLAAGRGELAQDGQQDRARRVTCHVGGAGQHGQRRPGDDRA